MNAARRFSLLVTAGLLGIAVMLGAVNGRPRGAPSAAHSLAESAAYFDSTIVEARSSDPRGFAGDELAIALGYVERLRLGLGSPFRLVDEATHDPRLGTTMSTRVGWALLARLERGDAYVIDPAVLDGAGPWAADGHGATGLAHLALIEHAVSSASDPRAGELAVRLAYMLESAKGSLARSTQSVAVQVAALVRDRQLAATDVRNLLTDATTGRVSALDLVAERRALRGFRVEAPPLAPLSTQLQMEAMAAAPGLVRALDTLDRVAARPLANRPLSPTIGPGFAARLASLAERRPPVPQVVVTLRSQSATTLRAWNDEMLTAAYARLATPTDSSRRRSALTLLSAAVTLRSVAQAAPWFPGDGGPDASDLSTEFGLAGVTFARGVPPSWRPYYLRELQKSFRDMQRVLPAFSPSGLQVRFGIDALRDSALAMHDPRTRTLQLSIFTSAGTLAHELAHDLDWQTSRRLYPNGVGYSTDRAMLERDGALSSSLRGLAEARLLRPFGPTPPPAVGRPAELFARDADWFIASSLAQNGRTNGFLSAVEDGVLAGYAAGQPTALGTSGARSLTAAIGEMTYLPDSTSADFEAQWSDPRIIDPALLVRRALETPVSWRGVFSPSGGLAAYFPPPPAELCTADRSAAARARENILILAIDARARGMALRRAHFRPAGPRADWANSVLGVAPWAPEQGNELIERLRVAIAAELTTAMAAQGVVPAAPTIFASSALSCSTISR